MVEKWKMELVRTAKRGVEVLSGLVDELERYNDRVESDEVTPVELRDVRIDATDVDAAHHEHELLLRVESLYAEHGDDVTRSDVEEMIRDHFHNDGS